jgi:hypothetical protein
MPSIKITLQRLVDLFSLSVNDDALDVSVRKFAARLMTLAAHSIRIEAKADALNAHAKAVDTQIASLVDVVQELAKRQGINTEAPKAQAAPQSPPAPAAAAAPVADESEENDESPEAFEQRALAEAQSEVAKINAIDVTPLRKTNSGGKKAANTGDAA